MQVITLNSGLRPIPVSNFHLDTRVVFNQICKTSGTIFYNQKTNKNTNEFGIYSNLFSLNVKFAPMELHIATYDVQPGKVW